MHYCQKLPDVFIYGKNIYFFFQTSMTFSFTFYYLANCPKDRKRSDWLAACDRQTVHLITFPVRLPPVDNPQDALGCKTLRSNLTSARWKSLISNNNNNTKHGKEENKTFCFLSVSAVGELMFLSFVSHLMVK